MMNTANRAERLWIGGAALLGLLIVVVGWFFLISPQRDETADVESQTTDAQTQNVTLQGRISQLSAQKKNLKVYAATLARARQALPDQRNMSLFLRDIQTIAGATSTRVTSLTVGDPVAVTPAAPVAGATPSAGSSAPTAAAPAGAGGIFAIPIDASVTGNQSALSNFLTRLQSEQPRVVLLTSVIRNADPSTGSVLQLKMSAFVAPSTAATSSTAAAPSTAPTVSTAPTGGS